MIQLAEGQDQLRLLKQPGAFRVKRPVNSVMGSYRFLPLKPSTSLAYISERGASPASASSTLDVCLLGHVMALRVTAPALVTQCPFRQVSSSKS